MRTWWSDVHRAYLLEAHDEHILTLCCEPLDRAEEARQALAEHRTRYVDRFGQPRARPEVAIERDARIASARLLRQLALHDEPEPPRLRRR
jgi:hypothetical protein